LQKSVKGTVEIARQRARATVPFGKNGQGTVETVGCGAQGTVPFAKKAAKARSKSEVVGRRRPCLLEKSDKGTVEIARQRAWPTVPFAKKRQRHGRNRRLRGVADRAFCKKTSKARSKSRGKGRGRPCLLQKSVKGTVEIARQRAQPTVPFAKNGQRHGRNREAKVAADRAFCKKASKARSKSQINGHRHLE